MNFPGGLYGWGSSLAFTDNGIRIINKVKIVAIFIFTYQKLFCSGLAHPGTTALQPCGIMFLTGLTLF